MMASKPLVISVGITLLLAGGCLFLLRKSPAKPTNAARVAVLYPASHPAMDEIIQGLRQTFKNQSKTPIDFLLFNANGNKTLLRSQAEEIASHSYDAVVSIGFLCSHLLYEVSHKRRSSSPLIFVAVEDVAGLGITMEDYPATGICDTSDMQAQMKMLQDLKPNTKTVLLVYDPTAHNIQKSVEKLVKICKTMNLGLKTVQVYQTNEIRQKVENDLEGVDVVLVLTDHTVVSGIDSLVALCSRRGITLYASDLLSAQRGAALAFGVTEFDYGAAAAQQLLLLIDQKKPIHSIPITAIASALKVAVNSTTMQSQGLALTEHQLATIEKNGGIVYRQ